MKKLSDYKDDDALDLLADIIEPATAILADAEIKKAFEKSKLAAIKVAIKAHKPELMQIMARMDGVPVEEYHCNVLTLPARLLQILSDEDLTAFFTDAAQTSGTEKHSGSATEVIKGGETA